MLAVRLCISKLGILYLDENYQCWVFEFANNKFLPLHAGKAITMYCVNGFHEIDAEIIKTNIYYSGALFNDDDPWYKDNCNTNIYHTLHDVKPGMPYDKTVMPWFDQLLQHPVLFRGYGNDLIQLNYITYKDGELTLFKNEHINFDAESYFLPLSDAELDSFKHGEITEPWYLPFPTTPVLCHLDNNSIYEVIEYVPNKVVRFYRQPDELCERDIKGATTITPFFDTDLDNFKCGEYFHPII